MTQPAIPCGLVAKSIFNDTYELYKVNDNGANDHIDIDTTGIAWSSDISYKYKNIEKANTDYRDIQWYDMTDEHFIVWMRTAGLPNFRKLWGRIDDNLKAGKYVLKIHNNYEVKPF